MNLATRHMGLEMLLFLSMASLQCHDAPPPGITPPGPTWVSFNKSNSGLLNNHVHAILPDAEGIMWFATDSGAYTYSRGSWGCFWDDLAYPVYINNGNPSQAGVVTSIALAPDQSVWFGLAGGGVARYNRNAITKVWKRFTSADGLPSDFILSVAANSQLGEIWCSSLAGVGRFIPTANEGGVWVVYDTSKNKLPSNLVRCVAYNPIDFSIWFGTQNAGVIYINGDNAWEPPISFPGPVNYPITAIAFDLNTTWFASWGGILSHARTTSIWRQYVSDNTHGVVPNGIINAVTTDYVSTRWFGTNGGMVRLKDTSWTKFDRQSTPQLPSDTVTAFAYDVRGNLWIGTMNGVAVFNEAGTRF